MDKNIGFNCMGIHDISFSSEKIFEVFNFQVTNTFILTIIVGLVIFILLHFGLRKEKMIPNSFQNFIEWALESILHFIDGITGDRKKTEDIFPVASTLFILILFANLLEILPGLGIFHFLRSPSSDLNFTLALAISSMAFVHILAIRRLGISCHLKKFLNFKSPILFFVGILEGFSEIIKVLSLAVRLFGNIFAGEVLLLATSFLFVYFLPIPFLLLEILVGFIQALIFSSLIVIFYTTAVSISH